MNAPRIAGIYSFLFSIYLVTAYAPAKYTNIEYPDANIASLLDTDDIYLAHKISEIHVAKNTNTQSRTNL